MKNTYPHERKTSCIDEEEQGEAADQVRYTISFTILFQ